MFFLAFTFLLRTVFLSTATGVTTPVVRITQKDYTNATPPSETAGTLYFIGVVADNGDGDLRLNVHNKSGPKTYYGAVGYTTPLTTFPASTILFADYDVCVSANYTAGGGGGTTQTPRRRFGDTIE